MLGFLQPSLSHQPTFKGNGRQKHVIFPDRMTPTEVAETLGVQEGTLAKWRSTGRYGLAYFKLGKRVFYRRADVEAFIESRRFVCTAA